MQFSLRMCVYSRICCMVQQTNFNMQVVAADGTEPHFTCKSMILLSRVIISIVCFLSINIMVLELVRPGVWYSYKRAGSWRTSAITSEPSLPKIDYISFKQQIIASSYSSSFCSTSWPSHRIKSVARHHWSAMESGSGVDPGSQRPCACNLRQGSSWRTFEYSRLLLHRTSLEIQYLLRFYRFSQIVMQNSRRSLHMWERGRLFETHWHTCGCSPAKLFPDVLGHPCSSCGPLQRSALFI